MESSLLKSGIQIRYRRWHFHKHETSCASLSEATSYRTFDLHVGNLGFKTPYGYFGVGTFETPYKTMGQYDKNIDTPVALNDHGGTIL